ncbi:MAG: hypothetical protein ACKVOH_07090 [Chlamydiales bacterium]
MRTPFLRWIWPCLFLLLIGIALFPIDIFLSVVQWQTKSYFKRHYGATLALQKVEWERGKICFYGGHISKKQSFDAHFTKMVLTPNVDAKNRKVGGLLEVYGLDVVHKKRESLPFSSKRSKRGGLFGIDLEIVVLDAELLLCDGKKEIVFGLDLHQHIGGKQNSGTLTLDWDFCSTPLATQFTITPEEESIILVSDFSNHSLEDLYTTLHHFFELPKAITDWKLERGDVIGHLVFSLYQGRLAKVAGKLKAKEIELKNPILGLSGSLDHFYTELDFDFSSSLHVDSWNGEFSLRGGSLAWQQTQSEFWNFHDLHSSVCVREGKVENSYLRGTFLGMEGEIDLNWHVADRLIQMRFSGMSQEMFALIPEPLQKGFKKAFLDDQFLLEATVKQACEGLKLEGALKITEKSESSYSLQFGCHLGGGEEEKISLVPVELPFSVSPPMSAFLSNIKEQFYLSQRRLGWFHGEGFPLQKFLSPFLFSDVDLQLVGKANFEGTFDERYLVLFYEGVDFLLKGKAFQLSVPRVNEELSDDFVAVHYLDLKSWDHVGLLSLQESRFDYQKYGVCLEDMQGVVHFENNSLSFKEIEARWKNIYFRGEADVTLHSIADIDLKLAATSYQGPMDEAIECLHHFVPSAIWQWPFRGEIGACGEGFVFHFNIGKENRLVSASFAGECNVHLQWMDLACENYHFQVAYRFPERHITIEKGFGHLMYRGKTYPFVTPLIAFDPGRTQFQVAVHDLFSVEGRLEEGDLLITGKQGKDPIKIEGKKEGNRLFIEQASIALWSSSFVIDFRSPVCYEISHFHLGSPQWGKVLLSGEFFPQEKRFAAAVEEISLDVRSLFPSKFALWEPVGVISGKGTLQFDGRLTSDITASFYDLSFGGIYFGDGENLQCSFDSSKGLTIEGLEAEISLHDNRERYKLGCLHYDLAKEKLHFDGFDFTVPPERLPFMAEIAAALFPGKFSPTVLNRVEVLKQNEPLVGRLSLELLPDHFWVYLTLKDGTYHIFNKKFEVKEFSLVYDPQVCDVTCKCLYGEKEYGLRFQTDSQRLETGTISLSPFSFAKQPQEAIIAEWINGVDGWSVTSLQGTFAGSSVDLKATQKGVQEIFLRGETRFDCETLFPHLPDRIKDIFTKISLSGVYHLEGDWSLAKEDLFNSHFVGKIQGDCCKVKGIEFARFDSAVVYSKESIEFVDVSIQDWSGELLAGKASFVQEKEKWRFFCDQLQLNNFRLSRLKSPWTNREKRDRPIFRSFCVPHLELNHFGGVFWEKESIKGSGVLQFTNYPKRTFFSNLMLIPTEITARIGLDITSIIPVRGIIYYTLCDSKVYLENFHEMYSDGKHSRFYLAEGCNAYIDFDGQLDMKVRMKQYSLLMKLADLFTVNIKGSLFHPIYHFTNQNDN